MDNIDSTQIDSAIQQNLPAPLTPIQSPVDSPIINIKHTDTIYQVNLVNLDDHLKGKTIIITGGLGYIGSILSVELIKRLPNIGKIVIIDDGSNSKLGAIGRIKDSLPIPNTPKVIYYPSTDIRDFKSMDQIFTKHSEIYLVFHLAAKKAVGESMTNPTLYYDVNVGGTLVIMRLMKKHKIPKFIFASSAAIYGNPIKTPIDEKHPLNPISPYGKSKKYCEELIKEISMNPHSRIQTIALRYFNPTGAHIDNIVGEDCHGTPSNLMPYVAKVATQQLPILNIFGSDYKTPDGTPIRDYIHVFDIVEAHFSAMKLLTQSNYNIPFDVFNIGTGVGSSVLDVVKAMEKSCTTKVNHRIVERRDGDTGIVISDISRAKVILGWSPLKNMDDMCKSAYLYEHFKKNELDTFNI